ncbi:hypothetical protein T439DRAFT_346447 [Meredithblackwellia eburnea MCA 4105]
MSANKSSTQHEHHAQSQNEVVLVTNVYESAEKDLNTISKSLRGKDRIRLVHATFAALRERYRELDTHLVQARFDYTKFITFKEWLFMAHAQRELERSGAIHEMREEMDKCVDRKLISRDPSALELRAKELSDKFSGYLANLMRSINQAIQEVNDYERAAADVCREQDLVDDVWRITSVCKDLSIYTAGNLDLAKFPKFPIDLRQTKEAFLSKYQQNSGPRQADLPFSLLLPVFRNACTLLDKIDSLVSPPLASLDAQIRAISLYQLELAENYLREWARVARVLAFIEEQRDEKSATSHLSEQLVIITKSLETIDRFIGSQTMAGIKTRMNTFAIHELRSFRSECMSWKDKLISNQYCALEDKKIIDAVLQAPNVIKELKVTDPALIEELWNHNPETMTAMDKLLADEGGEAEEDINKRRRTHGEFKRGGSRA